jgi:hypothetical protein
MNDTVKREKTKHKNKLKNIQKSHTTIKRVVTHTFCKNEQKKVQKNHVKKFNILKIFYHQQNEKNNI